MANPISLPPDIPFPPPVDLDDLLHPFQRFGVNLGLDRIRTLLAALGNPQNQVPIVHVAGTNGKGSVCAYGAAILAAAGYRVGCHTSPHLVSWCERITINQVPIPGDRLRTLLEQTLEAVKTTLGGSWPGGFWDRGTIAPNPSLNPAIPTLFEIMSAATWLYFAQEQVDLAVMEVGLGGRLDATNVVDRPLVSVITSIGRDHWQVLGPTLGHIAREKAGILKPHCPAVVGILPPEAAAVVEEVATALPCPLTWVPPAKADRLAHYPVQTLESQGIVYQTWLQGEHQRQNSALALAAIHSLRHQGWSITDRAIRDGMLQARWPGRLQWVTWENRSVLLDGAHNVPSAEALRRYVDGWLKVNGDRSTTWIVGMLDSKEHDGILRALLRSGDRLHTVPVPSHNSADPADLIALAQSLGLALPEAQAHGTLPQALTAALHSPPTRAPLVVLCGSLYLLGHYFAHHHQNSTESSF